MHTVKLGLAYYSQADANTLANEINAFQQIVEKASTTDSIQLTEVELDPIAIKEFNNNNVYIDPIDGSNQNNILQDLNKLILDKKITEKRANENLNSYMRIILRLKGLTQNDSQFSPDIQPALNELKENIYIYAKALLLQLDKREFSINGQAANVLAEIPDLQTLVNKFSTLENIHYQLLNDKFKSIDSNNKDENLYIDLKQFENGNITDAIQLLSNNYKLDEFYGFTSENFIYNIFYKLFIAIAILKLHKHINEKRTFTQKFPVNSIKKILDNLIDLKENDNLIIKNIEDYKSIAEDKTLQIKLPDYLTGYCMKCRSYLKYLDSLLPKNLEKIAINKLQEKGLNSNNIAELQRQVLNFIDFIKNTKEPKHPKNIFDAISEFFKQANREYKDGTLKQNIIKPEKSIDGQQFREYTDSITGNRISLVKMTMGKYSSIETYFKRLQELTKFTDVTMPYVVSESNTGEKEELTPMQMWEEIINTLASPAIEENTNILVKARNQYKILLQAYNKYNFVINDLYKLQNATKVIDSNKELKEFLLKIGLDTPAKYKKVYEAVKNYKDDCCDNWGRLNVYLVACKFLTATFEQAVENPSEEDESINSLLEEILKTVINVATALQAEGVPIYRKYDLKNKKSLWGFTMLYPPAKFFTTAKKDFVKWRLVQERNNNSFTTKDVVRWFYNYAQSESGDNVIEKFEYDPFHVRQDGPQSATVKKSIMNANVDPKTKVYAFTRLLNSWEEVISDSDSDGYGKAEEAWLSPLDKVSKKG